MNQPLLTLPGSPVVEDTRPAARSAVIPSDIPTAPLPDCLFRYDRPENWTAVPIDALIGKSANTLSHIFISDPLRKAYNLNQLFHQIRRHIRDEQLVAFRIVTAENVKQRLQRRYAASLFLVYYLFHFLLRRVLPKLKGFRKLCRLLHIPVDVSKAEIIGRLMYKGFSLVDCVDANGETIILMKRDPTGDPSAEKPTPSEGFLFRMQRMGQDGQPIEVYKLRSMHPYAEYVQAYLHTTQGLMQGGKFRNDFRVSTGGKLLRKYWVDELPMLYNWLRGDIKLIGVRPISAHYFSLYPQRAQAIRLRHKPGLLPPYYADLPQTFDEIVESELAYLLAYEQAPARTDLRYLKRIITNIVVHKARSN